MVFSSLIFLFFFLPLSLLFYFIVPKRWRNLVLLAVSLLFYAWGEPIYVGLMILSTVFDYGNGLLIEHFEGSRAKQRAVVWLSVIGNLGLLGFFKYSAFFMTTLNQGFGLNLPVPDLLLPIGISFYSFQTMSYTIDVFRKEAKAQRNILDLGAYVTMFPQLIAGPIVRYRDVATQLNHRITSWPQFARGVERFVVGLSKKVLLANPMGEVWTLIASLPAEQTSVVTIWLGLVAFGLQLYFDFSGYSDMAIGLGRLFGFELLENFNYPYVARSISDFWRRWHMSLGQWFRDYVYIPLGGSRVSAKRQGFNLLVVWFLTGFWHGASWNFIIWGLYFGGFIALEKAGFSRFLAKHRLLSHGYVISILLIGWGFFAFDSLPLALDYLGRGFDVSRGLVGVETRYVLQHFGLLLGLGVIASVPWHSSLINRLDTHYPRGFALVKLVGLGLLLVLSTAYLVDASFNPFLYFRF